MTALQTFRLPDTIRGGEPDFRLAHELIRAWQTYGILQVATDPAQDRITMGAIHASKRFFQLPMHVKARHVSDLTYSGYIASGEEVTAGEADYSEIFTVCNDVPLDDPRVQQRWPCHGPVPWPDLVYKRRMQTFMDRLGALGEKLLRLTALGLDLPDIDALTSITVDGWHHMRVLRFPARSEHTSRGIGAHTDYHRVFDSPRDTILWDTGHQAYVHKLVTGRLNEFNELRQRGGMSGYPSRAESPHDVIENSHASVALSYADGLAKARQLAGPGQTAEREIVVVVGDGALTGGMAWEALNNLGAAPERPVIVVVNDNGRSYSPTVGGLAGHLAAQPEQAAQSGNVFTGLGLDYVGPVDGHDVSALEAALHDARGRGRPVVVHCRTVKGRGYLPAETDQADRMHGPPPFEPSSGRPRAQASPTWTNVLGAELVDIARRDPRVVAITAAMTGPVGLTRFTEEFPDRVFDVGIAEQHAIASAAGLALAGLHPVACVYATFINRAFDQLLMDVALHRLPLTLVLDRAGVTGEDGASHHGMWDLATLSVIPGLRIAAPRDGGTLRRLLREAVAIDGPTVLRFPKGAARADIPALGQSGSLDILTGSAAAAADVLIVAVGATAPWCLQAAAICRRLGVEVVVVDPRWVTPVPDDLIDLAGRHRLVVTVEDGCRDGGVGSALGDALSDRGVNVPVRRLGIPRRFLHQGSRAEVLRDVGLTPEAIARAAAAGDATRPTGSLLAFAS